MAFFSPCLIQFRPNTCKKCFLAWTIAVSFGFRTFASILSWGMHTIQNFFFYEKTLPPSTALRDLVHNPVAFVLISIFTFCCQVSHINRVSGDEKSLASKLIWKGKSWPKVAVGGKAMIFLCFWSKSSLVSWLFLRFTWSDHCRSGIPCKNGTGILAGSCQDPAKIPAGIPPRFWPPGFPVPAGILGGKAGFPAAKISAGSRRESCRDSWREAGFPAAKISAGSRRESCRDSWRETGFPAAKISAGSRRESCRDSWRETGFPAAKISAGSRRESCRDSWRETGFPAAKISAGSRWESCRDSWREAGSRRPKSRQDPGGSLAGILGGQPDISVGVLPGFATGNKIPCGQNLPGSQNLRGSCLESCRDSRWEP